MQRSFWFIITLLSAVLWQGCFEEVQPLDIGETNHLIILGELHHPDDYATVIVKELSSANGYRETLIEAAQISLYKKSETGETTKLPVEFKFDTERRMFVSHRRIATTVGETYKMTIKIDGREGEYETAEETLLPIVPILGVEDNHLDPRILFSDPKGIPNQYLVQSKSSSDFSYFTEMTTGIDTLFDGNESAYIEVYFSAGYYGIQLSNISPSTYGFYKSMLEQADQNEYYGELENGDPSFLFRSLPPQLTSNILNTEHPNEMVLGNFGVFSNSFFHP